MQTAIYRLARNGKGLKLAIPTRFAHALAWPIGAHIYMRLNADDTITLVRVPEPTINNARHGAPA